MNAEQIKALFDHAAKTWPNDYSTQLYWINSQIKAFFSLKVLAASHGLDTR